MLQEQPELLSLPDPVADLEAVRVTEEMLAQVRKPMQRIVVITGRLKINSELSLYPRSPNFCPEAVVDCVG